MPELPEVETVRRGLAPAMEGRRIVRAVAHREALRFPLPPRFAARLTGARVERMGRRAKYLLAHLDSGETLLMHLGMSGSFMVRRPAAKGGAKAEDAAGKHDHVVFEMEDGGRVVFNDPRRFGFMDLIATDGLEQSRWLKDLGPEPLSNHFSSAYLDEALAGKSTSIKAALMDQRVVAGLGNIYVCEALYRARISPKRLARTIPGARSQRLAPAVRAVLQDAIKAGGSTLKDYRRADGELGLFQHKFQVYGREGEKCPDCPGVVKRIVQGGRSTFFCPSCQR
jgi:formamidopyrimidine-DNA glycosylase